MNASDLLTILVARGVEFQAHGDELRFRPPERLTPPDLENLREHKATILRLLRSEGIVYGNRFADPRPMATCDRCGSTIHNDVPIHGGWSILWDCAKCNRFLGWPRWHGRTQG
jgi:hypothetical protein